MSRPIVIAVDFDGTLCSSCWPEIGEPHPGIITYCIAQRASGAKLILWTCRAGKLLDDAVEWCKSHHLEFDAVNDNLPEHKELFGDDTRKVFADVYIDDKNASIADIDKIGTSIFNAYVEE